MKRPSDLANFGEIRVVSGSESLRQGFGLLRRVAEGASDGIEGTPGLALEFPSERLGVALERVLECGALSYQRFTVAAQIAFGVAGMAPDNPVKPRERVCASRVNMREASVNRSPR